MYNNATSLYNLNNKNPAVTENATQFHISQIFTVECKYLSLLQYFSLI